MASIEVGQRDELESIIHELEEENRYYFDLDLNLNFVHNQIFSFLFTQVATK